MTSVRKPETQILSPALCVAIGKAAALSKLAAQEILGLDVKPAGSNITADDYLCLLFALRDTIDEIRQLGGVSS